MCSKRVLGSTIPKAPITAIVSDDLEIRQLLVRACAAQTSASLKVRGSENMLRSRLIDINPMKEGIHLAFSDSLNLKTLSAETELHAAKECMILIYLEGRSIIGFNAEPAQLLEDRLIFNVPDRLFKIQRRRDVRFLIPAAYEYTVEIDSLEQVDTRVRKRIIDISENGLSFFVLSSREAGLFRPGMQMAGCIITINSMTIPVDMRICSQSKHDRGAKGSGQKIGVAFESIRPDDKKFLAEFIYSNASHLFY